jgi:hypothetical protein
MPSQSPASGWDFSSVIDFIDLDPYDVGSPTLHPQTADRSAFLPEGGVGLGDFSKLYESLGMPIETAVASLPALDESELSNSDDAAPASPAAIQTPIDEAPTGSAPSHSPTIHTVNYMNKNQRRKARRQAEKVLQEQAAKEEDQLPQLQDAVEAVVNHLMSETAESGVPPSKLQRTQSNVGAKIRSASPVPAPDLALAPQSPTPAPRPALKRVTRRSPVAPNTPCSYLLPVSQPTLHQVPYNHGSITCTTSAVPAPFQYALAPPYLSQLQPSQVHIGPVTPGLVPRTVRPVNIQRQALSAVSQAHASVPAVSSAIPVSPAGYATPWNKSRPTIAIRQQVDRHFHLFEKLLVQFPHDRKWLVSPLQLLNENTKPEGIHVFVDASNIMIGFKDMLRNHGVQPYDMSFDSLALLMERRRPTAKRALVGSHREADPLPATQRLIGLAKAVGYQCDVQEQVFISREESSKKKFFNDVSRIGWHKAIQKHSGSGSDSETGAAAAPKTPSAPKWVEQGVDELLHLKMCQSILDTDVPSTMVLATGDGAEAEMSDGFLAHVERALRRGWKVELITWRQQMSGGYKRKAFRQKWGEQFTIIELDDFLEDLIETP